MSHTLNFDGGCHNNGRPDATGSWAYTIRLAGRQDRLRADSGHVAGPVITCNTAEWWGVISGLEALAAVPNVTSVLIQGDSQLIIHQLTGQWRAKKHFRELCDAALNALEQLGVAWNAIWVPREENQECDDLAGRMTRWKPKFWLDEELDRKLADPRA